MDYNNGQIYTIRSFLTDKFYIGSTTQSLCKRIGEHKGKYNTWKSGGNKIYRSSFEIIKFGDAYIELLEVCACKTKAELNRREGELIRQHKNDVVNIQIARRSNKEWFVDNKEHIIEYQHINRDKIKATNAEYRQLNRDKIKEQTAEYYNHNRDKIKETNAENRKLNCDKIKEQHAEYRKLNCDKIKEQQAEYRKLNCDKIKEQHAEYCKLNCDKIKEQRAEYCKLNCDKIKEQRAEYRKLNCEK